MIPIPILDGVLALGKDLLDRFIPDPIKKAEALMELERMKQTKELAEMASNSGLLQGQLEINKVEAASPNVFNAWRPAVGWSCAIAFFYSYVVLPSLQFLVYTFGTADMVAGIKQLPDLAMGTVLLPVLLGMLGLRTYEKQAGVESNR